MTRVFADVMATIETTGHGVSLEPRATRERRQIGRYSVDRLLGSGGMGEVYAARDPELDRMVAIKVLRPEISSTRANSRLHREARAMAKLSHPNLIAVYDVGIDGGQLFVAMELIAGQTLRSWACGKRATEIIAAYIAAGRGLAAAHGAGIVHRDFKPDNVLVGNDGRVVVSDLGLARTIESTPDSGHAYAIDAHSTQAGALLGTVRYMAPEQLERRDADERSDQFAFCIALWEALDADPFGPVDPASDSETCAQRRREAITARGELRLVGARLSNVPARVRRALTRGLAIDPASRWSSIPALLAELAAPRRRYRAVIAATAAACIGVGAFVTMRPQVANADPCVRVADDIARTWSLGDHERVITAFVASGAPHAAAIGEEIVALLDRRVTAWKLLRIDSCHAADPRRTSCLEAKRGELRGLVDRLETTPNVGGALTMTSRLAWTEQCGDAPPPVARTAPTFAASTLWQPSGVYTPATGFALVDLDGHLQSVQRGLDGLLHVAIDVKTDAAVPGSPPITDDAPAVGVDRESNTVIVAARGTDGNLVVGTADAERVWTWETLGSTETAPSLVVEDGVVVIAWVEHGHARTRARRAAGAAWTEPRDLGEAAPMPPSLASNQEHALAIAFATRDGKLAIRSGKVDCDWQPAAIDAPAITGAHVASWGKAFVVAMRGRDQHAYAAIARPDGTWNASERVSDLTVIEPPTLVEFDGVTIVLARDQDRALRYWVRNPSTRAYRYSPAQMWIGGRIVSGFGIGATPPAAAIAGTQLYASTRGIDDHQLYSLNLGRFVAVDVLGAVFGMPLGSLDVDPSANLFGHMRAFLALPVEHAWSIVTPKTVEYPSATRQDPRELFVAWLRFDSARHHLAQLYGRVFTSERDFVVAARQYRWGGKRTSTPKQYAWLRDHYFDGIEYDSDGFPLR